MKLIIKANETGSDATASAAGLSASCTMGAKHAAKRLAEKLSAGAAVSIRQISCTPLPYRFIFAAEWADHPELLEAWAKYDKFGWIICRVTAVRGIPLDLSMRSQSHVGSAKAAALALGERYFAGRPYWVLPGASNRHFYIYPRSFPMRAIV